jgi:hypothetical protein
MTDIEEIFEAVLELAIKPAALKLGAEARQSINLEALLMPMRLLAEKSIFLAVRNSDANAVAKCEARIILRDSGYPCRFMAEAIFSDFSPGTGFSGFAIRGRVKRENGVPNLKLTAYTNFYNVKGWSREFQSC